MKIYKIFKYLFKKINNMEEFKEDEIVWAKVKGFSWWPAIVRYIFKL